MSVVDVTELSDVYNQSKLCRICLDNDNPDDIISPCLCSGGSAYVHRKCLNNWRSMNKNGKGFKSCDICQFEYIIETIISDSEADKQRRLKYYLFVIRDLTAIISLIQLVIIAVAFLLKAVDENSGNIKNLFPNLVQGFLVYYLSAIILLLAIVGLIGVSFIYYQFINNNGTGTNNSDRSRNSNSRSNTGSGNGLFMIVIAIVLIFAFIGIIVGIILSVIILRKIIEHHTGKLWLRQEAEKYIVKDFQEQKNELEKYKNIHPMSS